MSRSVQWLNENSYRAYPFVEDSNMTAGSITIPLSAILDFSLINYAVSARRVRLLRFVITADVVPQGIFYFGYEGDIEFTVTVPASASFPFKAITFVADLHMVTCIFGAGIPELLANPAGMYTLNTPVPIEPALLSFQNKHRVNSVTGTALGSAAASGLVYLTEGYNCNIAVTPSTNTVVLSAIYGAGAGINCNPIVSAAPVCKDVLLSINGFHADDNGNFELLGGEGVTIIPVKGSALVRIVSAKKLDELGCG